MPAMTDPAMRYFFHLVGDHASYPDDMGWRFNTIEDAKAEAVMIARDLATDDNVFADYVVCVADDSGQMVALVPVEPNWDLQ
jgi:hypothetical protein